MLQVKIPSLKKTVQGVKQTMSKETDDVSMTEEKYVEFRKALLEAFESRFPKKSRFEK